MDRSRDAGTVIQENEVEIHSQPRDYVDNDNNYVDDNQTSSQRQIKLPPIPCQQDERIEDGICRDHCRG